MPHYLDLEAWPRRDAFHFFRTYDAPYFNVCTALEAGPLVEAVRASPGASLFLAYLYLSLRAANETPPFRYRLSGERVLVHERVHAGTTIAVDDERFAFAYFDMEDDFGRFQRGARRAMEEARARSGERGLEPRDDRHDLVHYSTLPWVSFTSISHARRWRQDDSVPKIVFGKLSEEGGRVRLPVSVEVHHALMDGLHVGRYLERLQGYLSDPAPIRDGA